MLTLLRSEDSRWTDLGVQLGPKPSSVGTSDVPNSDVFHGAKYSLLGQMRVGAGAHSKHKNPLDTRHTDT